MRRKIEEAAALDASMEEIAFYAGIHRSTLYEWVAQDKELSNRIQELREQPILKARRTIINALNDPNYSFKYLERKRRKEFGTNIDVTTDGQPLQINVIKYDGD